MQMLQCYVGECATFSMQVSQRVKRAAFGLTNFANYRIRALLYAGKPNWALLDTLTPP